MRILYGLAVAGLTLAAGWLVCEDLFGGENEKRIQEKEVWHEVRAYRTFYCAAGCGHAICGGNSKTAFGRDARVADGVAVDPRRIPYGSIVEVEGRRYVADDTFGKAQRERDRASNVLHIDVRVAGKTHDEVRRMGAGWITIRWLERRD